VRQHRTSERGGGGGDSGARREAAGYLCDQVRAH
jgi:hypothetical protein